MEDKLVLSNTELKALEFKLFNRFNILTYIRDYGIEWAVIAMDPNNGLNWRPDLYLDCYNNPEA